MACATTNQAPDVEHFIPMLEQVRDNCGRYPDKSMGDAGYWSERNVAFCEARGIDPYIATGRLHHDDPGPSPRGRPPSDLSPKQRMARKLRTKKGKEIYARRKAIAEPPFGQIMEARGIKRFLLRGLEKVCAEWAFIAATHNILKLFRSGKAGSLLRPATT